MAGDHLEIGSSTARSVRRLRCVRAPHGRGIGAVLSILAAALILSGCILNLGANASSPTSPERSTTTGEFQKALSSCRLQRPGRINRRVHLPASHPEVARCLKRRGWNTDGSRAPDEQA